VGAKARSLEELMMKRDVNKESILETSSSRQSGT
jgi:hypothetical protein